MVAVVFAFRAGDGEERFEVVQALEHQGGIRWVSGRAPGCRDGILICQILTPEESRSVMGDVTDSSGAVEQVELPVACTLGASDGSSRMQRWRHLHQVAALTAQLTNDQLTVRYRAGPGVLAELQDLVAQERVCCAFVSWAVDEEKGQPVMRVTAPAGSPHDIEPIAAMFAATDSNTELDEHPVRP